jgi:hypothetical protein
MKGLIQLIRALSRFASGRRGTDQPAGHQMDDHAHWDAGARSWRRHQED